MYSMGHPGGFTQADAPVIGAPTCAPSDVPVPWVTDVTVVLLAVLAIATLAAVIASYLRRRPMRPGHEERSADV